MTASAGETSIPAPVTLSVTDADVALMWDAVRRQRHGVSEPYMFWAGVTITVINIPFIYHGNVLGAWTSLGSGLLFIVASLLNIRKTGGTLHPTYLSFDPDGLHIDFSPPSGRRYRYAWCWIQRIDDVGESFVVVPRYDKRIVLPKRAFPDHGHEAWAFFAAHDVAGRVARLQPAVARP
jgi:hypothetical protein